MINTIMYSEKEVRSIVRSALPFFFLTIIYSFLMGFINISLSAQNYIGLGVHLTPAISFEHTEGENVAVRPLNGFGGSLTLKKEWANRQNRKWYTEAGITLQGLRYYQVNYTGDSSVIWSDYTISHTGFPSILLGAGYSLPIIKPENRVSFGVEASFLVTQTLDEIYSFNFSTKYHPTDDIVFPVFLRLALGYSRNIYLFNSFSGQVQLYSKVSIQDITKGTQYIQKGNNNTLQEGRYNINNSEFGVKLYTNLNSKKNKQTDSPRSGPIVSDKKRNHKNEISFIWQYYRASEFVYHIPQVDSFNISSRPIMLPQIGVAVEIPFKKNPLWGIVAGIGFGYRAGTLVFESDGKFPSNKQPINFEQSVEVGHYGIVNLGFSRKTILKNQLLSHSLTTSAMIPLERERTYLGVPTTPDSNLPIPYDNAILEGWIDYSNGREVVLVGIEYNPELIFYTQKSFFAAVGLVANYSFRNIAAHGIFKVENGQTTYYGASLQKFSKIGVSIRVGLAK